MSDQPTSLFSSSSGPTGSGGTLPGIAGLGGATTQPLDRPSAARRELAWHRGADLGLLLLRFAVGGVFFAHGMQHVFGMWGGSGIGGLASTLAGFGYQNTNVLVWVLALTELIGGAGVALGLLTPLAAAGLLALMINAVLIKAGNGFFIAGPPGAGAVELEVVLGLAAAAIVLTGPGRIALDNGRTWQRRPTPWGVLCLIIGVAAGLAVYLLLRLR
jgi:putative oxidoreductase